MLIQKNVIRIVEDPSKLWKYSKATKAQSASVPEKNGLNISQGSSVLPTKT